MVEVCTLDWHIAPMRADRWLDVWESAAAKCAAYGCKSWSLTRAKDDPNKFQQSMVWDDHADFERYWFSEELEQAREQVIGWYDIPMLPAWHYIVGGSQA
jgi:quinol monooxygenase YgiN